MKPVNLTNREMLLEIALQKSLIAKNKKRIRELDKILEFCRNRIKMLEGYESQLEG